MYPNFLQIIKCHWQGNLVKKFEKSETRTEWSTDSQRMYTHSYIWLNTILLPGHAHILKCQYKGIYDCPQKLSSVDPKGSIIHKFQELAHADYIITL